MVNAKLTKEKKMIKKRFGILLIFHVKKIRKV